MIVFAVPIAVTSYVYNSAPVPVREAKFHLRNTRVATVCITNAYEVYGQTLRLSGWTPVSGLVCPLLKASVFKLHAAR